LRRCDRVTERAQLPIEHRLDGGLGDEQVVEPVVAVDEGAFLIARTVLVQPARDGVEVTQTRGGCGVRELALPTIDLAGEIAALGHVDVDGRDVDRVDGPERVDRVVCERPCVDEGRR
jgi:hypothetical protein